MPVPGRRYDLRVEPGMSIRPYNAPVIWQRNYYEPVVSG